MSRIGRKPIAVPADVKVHVADRVVTVEGPLGKLDLTHRPEVTVEFDAAAKQIVVTRGNDERISRALHGLTRALVQNMVIGVTKGYERRLEVVGVGYLVAVQNNVLQCRVGLANELQVPIPEDLKVTCPDQTHVSVKGIDKQRVNHFAAAVRAMRKPEPYKGKGIRFEGEVVRRKAGKAMAK